MPARRIVEFSGDPLAALEEILERPSSPSPFHPPRDDLIDVMSQSSSASNLVPRWACALVFGSCSQGLSEGLQLSESQSLDSRNTCHAATALILETYCHRLSCLEHQY